MSYKFQIYPDPLDATCQLHHDSGFVGYGVQNNAPDGRPGQLIDIPDSVPSEHGAELIVTKSGFIDLRVRGFLVLKDGVARLQVDDYNLVPADNTDPEEPEMPSDPMGIINYVYESTKPDLRTKSGCGKFTEDCIEALHNTHHPSWGHIRKEPAQNQFNGHAVDAGMLLVPWGNTAPGIYDIIQNSESDEAKPAFNYKGPVEPHLWYYPPTPLILFASNEMDKRDDSKK